VGMAIEERERGGQETISPVLKVPRQCPLLHLVEVMNMIGNNVCMTLEGLHYSEVCSSNGVTIGRAPCEAHSATWNVVTNSALALGPRKFKKNLDRICRSQDFPDAS
jgi:hypothetical protein